VHNFWKAGIKAELMPKNNPKIQQQLNYSNTSLIPFSIIFGNQEVQSGTLQLKNMITGEQKAFNRAEMIDFIKENLDKFYSKKEEPTS